METDVLLAGTKARSCSVQRDWRYANPAVIRLDIWSVHERRERLALVSSGWATRGWGVGGGECKRGPLFEPTSAFFRDVINGLWYCNRAPPASPSRLLRNSYTDLPRFDRWILRIPGGRASRNISPFRGHYVLGFFIDVEIYVVLTVHGWVVLIVGVESWCE